MSTPTVTLDDLSIPAPPPGPADWTEDGVAVFDQLIPVELIANYQDEWAAANGFRGFRPAAAEGGDGTWTVIGDPEKIHILDAERPGGWPDTCPYMRHPALLNLCMFGPLAAELEKLTGEPMGLHLNLTGWTSTQRNWHQDGYLNPDEVGDAYAAVWIALDDVHSPDVGPFQFVPGSHRWHRLVQSKVFASGIIDPADPAWPTHTEAVLTDLVEAEIRASDQLVVDYLPNKGDVLAWHPRLYHRGSAPRFPNTYRPALIAHYSGIETRTDFTRAHGAPVQHPSGGWYWPIETGNPVRWAPPPTPTGGPGATHTSTTRGRSG